MVIEESVLINADINKIWKTFTDLTCWADWNSIATDVASGSGRLEAGERFTFCLRPFDLPIKIEPKIEEVVPREKVVWTGSRFGIFSRHEFLFQQAANGVLVTSREAFRGLPLHLGGKGITEKVSRDLVVLMLQQLKKACEREHHG
jgi:hypothetical protein